MKFYIFIIFFFCFSSPSLPTNQSQEQWEEFTEGVEISELETGSIGGLGKKNGRTEIFWLLGIITFTIIAAIFLRIKGARRYRIVFLISSLIILGFFRGGCPCPISGFQNFTLILLGVHKSWLNAAWFFALLPLVYFFGRVWCGWICHLGAFQEILYKPGKFNFLKSEKAQSILKKTRISLLIILVVQLAITRTNLYKEIDPFKAGFNLYASNNIAWVLLILLILSSIITYRPFCRAVCPIGLMFGWIGQLKKTNLIHISSTSCNNCRRCTKTCEALAISNFANQPVINNENCIACGECMDSCKKNAIAI